MIIVGHGHEFKTIIRVVIMKSRFKNSICALVLLAALFFSQSSEAQIYVFTTLHSFAAETTNNSAVWTNSDGAYPLGGLILSGNTLYGTASYGGTNGDGTLFKINTAGICFTVLHSFTNDNAGGPFGELTLSDDTLYGVLFGGGSRIGTVFAVNTNGTSFTILHDFAAATTNSNFIYTNNDGNKLNGGLILAGKSLYGTAIGGGIAGNGTLFEVNTDGTDFAVQHGFTALDDYYQTNSDGAGPSELILSGDTLYGVTEWGGNSEYGTIFQVNTNDDGFTVLHNFGSDPEDGVFASGKLILSNDALYGTTEGGGDYGGGNGTVFAIGTNGTSYKILHRFAPADVDENGNWTNSDGSDPNGGLVLSGDKLYGTTAVGGESGCGTVFVVSTNGNHFEVLHTFSTTDPNTYANSDGAGPEAGMTLWNSILYGTTSYGGSAGNGTVFSISLLPPLPTISLPSYSASGQFQMVVNGSVNQNYTVQMSTNLTSADWTPLLVTNCPSDSFLFCDPNATNQQRFYRVLLGP
ncbi:MAG TPA: choice-of-anchor tandem repeat GloVer-containing protein [Verrucomicrobiae bacterium]